jgi:hypothetical protein
MTTASDKTNGLIAEPAKAFLPGSVRVIYQRFLSLQDDRAVASVHSIFASALFRVNDAPPVRSSTARWTRSVLPTTQQSERICLRR